MERSIFSKQFEQELVTQGFKPGDFLNKPDQIKSVRKQTGLPDGIIRDGLFNNDRDVLRPSVQQAVKQTLGPWIDLGIDEIPSLTILEISRATGLSPSKVIQILTNYPVTISVNGTTLQSSVEPPTIPKNPSLKVCSDLGISTKRIQRGARYLSRAPGGGPVQKAGIQRKRLEAKIKEEARRRTKVRFSIPKAEVEDSKLESSSPFEAIESIVYQSERGRKILEIINWFKTNGFGKNWILGDNELRFAQILVDFSNGKPVDFLVWNCIGFEWFENPGGGYPVCNVTDNLDTAITAYFQQEIIKIVNVLSIIGNPQVAILIPSSEALDENFWQYQQQETERQTILNSTVKEIEQLYRSIELPEGSIVRVLRWDDYVKSLGIRTQPNKYTQQGIEMLRQSADADKIREEGARSGRSYFQTYGIDGVPLNILAEGQLKYYGMYVGEGLTLAEIQRDNPVVIINFEEMRVSQMTLRGAGGNLPIVTPISNQQMTRYYQWRKNQINTNNESTK